MATPVEQHLFRIEKKLKSVELLLAELIKHQCQREIRSLLVEMLAFKKQQSVQQNYQEEWLDSYEVMRLYRISRSTLYRWKQRELLHPNKIGNRDIFLRREVERLFQSVE
ncbi:MAG: helix-turn-helix domain-containing protein [Bacteroidetes bacterium]|nr:helix-turn-helix domain-containing protein [Bacteroidota bacterium]MBU1372246.1 helix-turn-helix domain-containing protein [Bacteroidota bacterium]MBU1484497.1 helix-turn-helix domain-containing protein [Bacteroidota bacterium]MBU1759717.1 helix-turn-helix domain-containing protein [Bacteroidota bacterium]MBU2045656.1 helix-turn-helix domain-containing protein [Bacteroidota bacterium]